MKHSTVAFIDTNRIALPTISLLIILYTSVTAVEVVCI